MNQTTEISQDLFSRRYIVIVTGLSGAGKTSVMRTLEDSGFYCVDNLPIPLLAVFLKLVFSSTQTFFKVALGIDARGGEFLQNFIAEIETIKRDNSLYELKIIFVNAQEQTILKRFQETRRKHPLSVGISLEHAIEKEKRIMEPIMALADVTLDTDVLNIHDLRNIIRSRFTEEQSRELLVNLVSFGFKYGVPAESNLVYDLRFLPNPYFIPTLKALNGKNVAIQDYLFANQETLTFWNHLNTFLHYSLARFHEEGRFFVTVALGCTGGKHRSVAFVEKLCKQTIPHIRFLTSHRDLGKE